MKSEVGTALREIAKTLDKTHTRRAEFKDYLDEVGRTYPGSDWPADLLTEAHEQGWRGWTVECLPSLAFIDGRRPALIWHYLAACIPKSYRREGQRPLCSGRVVEVSLGPEALAWAQRFAPIFEETRKDNPFPTDHSMSATLQEAIQTNNEVLASQGFSEGPLPEIDDIAMAFQHLSEDLAEEDRQRERLDTLVNTAKEMYPRLDAEIQRVAALAAR